MLEAFAHVNITWAKVTQMDGVRCAYIIHIVETCSQISRLILN